MRKSKQVFGWFPENNMIYSYMNLSLKFNDPEYAEMVKELLDLSSKRNVVRTVKPQKRVKTS